MATRAAWARRRRRSLWLNPDPGGSIAGPWSDTATATASGDSRSQNSSQGSIRTRATAQSIRPGRRQRDGRRADDSVLIVAGGGAASTASSGGRAPGQWINPDPRNGAINPDPADASEMDVARAEVGNIKHVSLSTAIRIAKREDGATRAAWAWRRRWSPWPLQRLQQLRADRGRDCKSKSKYGDSTRKTRRKGNTSGMGVETAAEPCKFQPIRTRAAHPDCAWQWTVRSRSGWPTRRASRTSVKTWTAWAWRFAIAKLYYVKTGSEPAAAAHELF